MRTALFLLCTGALCGQAMVEYSLGVGRSAAGAAAVGKKTARSTEAVFAGSAKGMDRAARAPRSAPARPAPARGGRTDSRVHVLPPAPPKPLTPALPPPDPGQISSGLDRQDLLQRFGPPAMKTTKMEGPLVLETYWYMAAGRDAVVVTLRDGKVAAVSSSAN